MRIAFLLDDLERRGGVERLSVLEANTLADEHDVEVIGVADRNGSPRDDLDPRVQVRHLGDLAPDEIAGHGPDSDLEARLADRPSILPLSTAGPRPSALWDVVVRRCLPEVRADLVVTGSQNLLAACTLLLPPEVALVHRVGGSALARRDRDERLIAFASRADALLTYTQTDADWLAERLGHAGPSVSVMPLPVERRDQPRSLLDQPVVITTGSLKPSHQHADLVRAFAAMPDAATEWRLRIFGEGPLRSRLLKLARRHRLFDRVELPGDAADLPLEWSRAGVAALTSQVVEDPVVAVESLLAGVPLVAYDAPTGPAEWIRHGENGFLVQRGDVLTFAGHLQRLAQDGELRRRMGDAAHETARRLKASDIPGRWQQVLESAVTGRRATPSPWLSRVATAPAAGPVGDRSTAGPRITPWEYRRDLVAHIARLLDGLADWIVLPPRGEVPPTVVIPEERRDAVLSSLRSATLPEGLSLAVTEADHWLPFREPVVDAAKRLVGALVPAFTLEPWPGVGGRTSHLVEGAGIRLEFWPRDSSGRLVARVNNPYTRTFLPSDIRHGTTVCGVEVPGLRELQGPFVDECRFPIDVVYTWVDDADPQWRASRDRAIGIAASEQVRREASGAARFRNRDELRYSMRGIHAYAPWVRNIYVVTAGQRPSWLVDHPQVSVVDHREILPAEALPTFNSHAIETALHRVPGLSEHFIYFNDDVLLARPLRPERFFTPGGNFAAFLSQATVGVASGDDRPHLRAGLNNRRLLRKRFGVTTTHTVAHTPHPMRKSVLDTIGEEFAEEVTRTERTRFRSPNDVTVTASLAQHYGLLTGSAYAGELDLKYVNTSEANIQGRLGNLLRRTCDAICLADDHDYALREREINAALQSFFKEYFPVPAPWESEG